MSSPLLGDDVDEVVVAVLARTRELKAEMLAKLGYDPRDRNVPAAEHGRIGRHAFCRAMLEFLDDNYQKKPGGGSRFVTEYEEEY